MLTLHWSATLACIALATISRSSAFLSPSSRTYWADSDKQQLTPERTLSNVRSVIRCCHRCQTSTQCVAVLYSLDTQLCHMATNPPIAGTGTPGCMTYQVSGKCYPFSRHEKLITVTFISTQHKPCPDHQVTDYRIRNCWLVFLQERTSDHEITYAHFQVVDGLVIQAKK